MKKLYWIILFCITIIYVTCSKSKTPTSMYNPDNEFYGSLNEIDRELDSMNALGMGLIVRGSDREYDTIIDHIRYIYVKEK